MIFDQFNADKSAECEHFIVGAGPVGLALAIRLSELGRCVAVLEAGKETPVANASGLSHHEVASGSFPHANAADAMRQGLGGTSSQWGARCSQLDAHEFEIRSYVPNMDTHVGFDEVLRHRQKACKFFGLEDEALVPAEQHSADTAVHDHHLIRVCPEQNSALRHMPMLRTTPNIRIFLQTRVLFMSYDAGSSCISSMELESRGTVVEIKPKSIILANGGIQSTRLLLALQRVHPNLFGGIDGPLGRYYMGHISGSIARIRLAVPSNARRFLFRKQPDGSHECEAMTLKPAAKSQHKLLDAHFGLSNFPIADPYYFNGALSSLHLALCARYLSTNYMERVWSAHRHTKFDFGLNVSQHAFNILRNLPQTIRGYTAIASWLLSRAKMPGFQIENPKGIYSLGFHAEHAPNWASRIQLSEQRDAYGIPLPKVDLQFTSYDFESIMESHEIFANWIEQERIGNLIWKANSRTQRLEMIELLAHDGYHQMGVTRISSSPNDGIVDKNLSVWNCRNLHLAGCGTLPTSGKSNPTFLAVILAIRLADHLTKRSRF